MTDREAIPAVPGLNTKAKIVSHWLPLYSGRELKDFTGYIILTNFVKYLEIFSAWHNNAEILGRDKQLQSVCSDGITIINFGMGSALAATMMDFLTAVKPKAVVFLGKCGGLNKKTSIGDFVLP